MDTQRDIRTISAENDVQNMEEQNISKELDMKMLKSLTDEQIKALLKQGFRLKHKTFEERLAEYGGEISTIDFDWGESTGEEY